ncbi:Carbohydrate-selective porin OprB [Paraburkholderia piptadeniae]|uniref:Carbohydrate-selective porin OprB n=1 Tax=Paraburkholderia piptadeniae TaxID=1701573 RepID=A0A1N7SEK1_9BURK|nr:carbohydrate porin [Paraburkholderia piptadeniae]SIT45807.1 Carbohydrate-selective porin OprB [Paraburkholderia piptadeniae]
MNKKLKTGFLLSTRPVGLALLLSLGFAPAAFAQTSEAPAPAPSDEVPAQASPAAAEGETVKTAEAPAAPTGIWERANLFGDMGGLRPWLGQYGVTLNLQETSEYLNNLSGGTQRGGAYDGLTQLAIGVDLEKAVGLTGGSFNVSALQIHGTNLTTRNLQTLQSASGIEADATTRLWELWYQQTLLGGKMDVKVGQQSLDQEFMVSQNATPFMNATFGWPVLPSVDMPAGGPAYPLSSLGVRVRAKPSDAVTVLAGVFDGNPAPGTGDPQKLNAHGTNFGLGNGALFIGEVQYALNQPSDNPADPKPAGLPGTYKLGFWYNTNHFADQRFDNTGLSLANPASTGIPQNHKGNYSFYAVADQMVWRPSADSPRSVNVFARIMGAPGDRNLVDLGMNAGVTLKAPFRGRDNDVAGLAVGYAKIGSHAQDLASDTAAFTTPGYPSRSAETVIEATYQYQVAPWWMLQADAQYFFRPSGGIPQPGNPTARIGNEFVLGIRTNIVF